MNSTELRGATRRVTLLDGAWEGSLIEPTGPSRRPHPSHRRRIKGVFPSTNTVLMSGFAPQLSRRMLP